MVDLLNSGIRLLVPLILLAGLIFGLARLRGVLGGLTVFGFGLLLLTQLAAAVWAFGLGDWLAREHPHSYPGVQEWFFGIGLVLSLTGVFFLVLAGAEAARRAVLRWRGKVVSLDE